ncbi:hypothetical protein RQP46_007496 [Phenoliferia psychrophenolica]
MVFSYLDPLLYKMAFPRPEDPPYSLASVPDLLPEDKSAEALRSYREGLKFLGRPRGLIISLLWFNREMLVLGHFWSYVKVLVIALPAYGLKLLLDHLAKRSRGELAPTHVAVLLALGIAAAQLVKAVAAAQSLTTSTTILIRTRALLVSEVFAKALRRSGGGTTSTAKGADITNIIGSDADDVAPAISRINIVFELFFSIIISMAFLVHVLGLAAFAGVGVLFLTMPLQTRFGQLFQRYQMRLRKTSDARISLVTEVIHGIRLVKYEAWEDVMRVKMDELRRQELAALWTKSLLRIVDLLFMSFTPIFVAVVTFVCHTKVLVDMITALVALRRIEAFLREPDTRKYSLLQTTAPVKIGFENASFTWASNPDEELGPNDFALRDISLDFPIGKLTAIVGRVGSGKSTLLTSLLGETTLISGRIFLPSPISRYYLRAMGGWWPALVAFGFFGAAQLSEIATSVALRFWAGSYDSPSKAATVMHDTDFWLMVYCLFALMDLVLFAARVAFWLRRALYAAETIYGDLVTSLLRTTGTTPTGRILNRLSADTNIVDGALPTLMMFLIFELFGVAGILGTITFIFPLFFLPASVILAIYGTIGFFCSVAKSPVFSLFGEAINGVVTLRAYGDTLRFLRKVFGLLDDQTRPTAITNVANRWLSIRCDLAGAAVSLATALFVVFSVRLDAALAGFVLSFAIWPSRDGSIEVEDLCVRYTAELPLALQGISFRVKPREKVGIVGRTGSGKSTLALSFFRFVEASAGKIIIDGIDIRTLSLAELRSRLVIVPQDALLLSGPLRQSLDPYEKHSDADLWDAVRQVHLAAPVDGTQAAPDQRFVVTSLDMEVENGGKNFSAGERQLVALARALLKLRSSSILILDESTASLDHATDAKIQATLREVMPDATVLCVAHRLRTIIDYPKALVMGDGKVLEYDAPWTLLERKDSAFSELCRRSGEEDVLRAMAFAARDAQI